MIWIKCILIIFISRAAKATKLGHFKAEIIPVTVEVEDKNGERKKITVLTTDIIKSLAAYINPIMYYAESDP